MPTLKELARMPDRITGGHRLCPGCGAPIAVRQILRGTDKPVVVVCATGCLEVATTISLAEGRAIENDLEQLKSLVKVELAKVLRAIGVKYGLCHINI